MAVETSVVGSPGWWFARLTTRLITDQRPKVERLDALYRGEHELSTAFSNTEQRTAFQEFLGRAQSNYLALVVEAVIERMKVKGFSTGDKANDDIVNREWQRAHLDADQGIVYRAMAATSLAYVIVGEHPRKSRPGKSVPLITIESAADVITEAYPDDRREQQAALKLWSDSFGLARATLYLPGTIYRYRSDKVPNGNEVLRLLYSTDSLKRDWSLVGEGERNKLGRVPVVPFTNRVSIDGTCTGEFEDVIRIQNRINSTLLHRLIAEKYAVFRQMAVLNLAFEEDENGDPVAPDLPSSPGVAWLLQGENLAIWQGQQTSTADILKGVEADIRDLAAITRTPPHYLLNGIVNASGDALSAAETGLVSKVKERIDQAGESWEIVLRLVALVLGLTDLADEETPLRIIWADPMYRSLAELSDAVVKQSTAGVPWRTRMSVLGYSPEEIDRMEMERTQDALLTALAAPPPAQTAPGTPGNAADEPEDDGGTE